MIYIFIVLVSSFSFSNWKNVPPDYFKISPPPVDGSVQDLQDHQKLLDLQQTRTTAQCDQAAEQWLPTYDRLFANSALLSASQFARAKNLIQQVLVFTNKSSSHYKNTFSRLRPYERFSDIEPCIEKLFSGDSYPSGHASMGLAGACILAEIYPAKKSELFKLGRSIGELRVLSGVHHPSDVTAGQNLGEQICEYLKNQKDFVQEMEAIP